MTRTARISRSSTAPAARNTTIAATAGRTAASSQHSLAPKAAFANERRKATEFEPRDYHGLTPRNWAVAGGHRSSETSVHGQEGRGAGAPGAHRSRIALIERGSRQAPSLP